MDAEVLNYIIVAMGATLAFFASMWIRRVSNKLEEVVTREELREHIDSLNQINLRDIKIAVVEAQRSCQKNKTDILFDVEKMMRKNAR